jgi:glycerol kinase
MYIYIVRVLRLVAVLKIMRKRPWPDPLHRQGPHRAAWKPPHQTREVLDAMNADSGVALTALKVDGGMVYNNLLMQFQADILGVPVIRPVVAETTALGAAYAAGLAVGYWKAVEDLRANWGKDKEWDPKMDAGTRATLYKGWKKAVTRTFDWVE